MEIGPSAPPVEELVNVGIVERSMSLAGPFQMIPPLVDHGDAVGDYGGR